MPDSAQTAFPVDPQGTAAAVDAALGQVTATADQSFLRIGEALSGAVDVFGKLAAGMTGLAGQLHGEQADSAVANLEQAMRGAGRLAENDDQASPLLLRLNQLTGEAGKQLQQLLRILTEVAALAINGKIQATHVADRGLDFSVFTSEVDRLSKIARAATERAAERLETVSACIASARAAAADFERNEGRELGVVRQRIDDSLTQLAARRLMSAEAAETTAARSQQISRRIAATVAELQINDNVCQRLEHIRIALKALEKAAAGESAALAGGRWPVLTPADRRRALAGVGALLLARQLRGGADDYQREVEGLIRNLKALAADAAAIQAEAAAAFSDGGGGLFMQEMAQDIARAGDLLHAYAAARRRAQDVVDQVSNGFQAMAADLATIRSIDTDMRIMGLNATLKCGRLGDDGRALGVVAHELRAYSKRTEECSRILSELLAQILELSKSLNAVSESEHAVEKTIPLEVMRNSVAALEALGGSLTGALAELRRDSDIVSHSLDGAADGVDIHRQVAAAAADAAGLLDALGAALAPAAQAGPPDDAVREDLDRLTAPLYTMERERLVHRIFMGDAAEEDIRPPAAAEPAGDADDIDNLFF